MSVYVKLKNNNPEAGDRVMYQRKAGKYGLGTVVGKHYENGMYFYTIRDEDPVRAEKLFVAWVALMIDR